MRYLVSFLLIRLFLRSFSLDILPSTETLFNIRHEFSSNNFCKDIGKKIPCQVWLTGKHLSKNHLPIHIAKFINKNKDWHANLVDDAAMHKFMRYAFNGTQVLWAYEQISHELGAARSDLWRYCKRFLVLFIFIY